METGIRMIRQEFRVSNIPYHNLMYKNGGESAWGGEESNLLRAFAVVFVRKHSRVEAGWERKGLDLRKGGTRGKCDFPDGNGRCINSCEPQ